MNIQPQTITPGQKRWSPLDLYYSKIDKKIYDKQLGRMYLNKEYAPQRKESVFHKLKMEGSLPKDFSGAYVRNGPNPYQDPKAGYHWFDGDGMLHASRIENGEISYSNQFVITKRLQEEAQANRELALRVGNVIGKDGLSYLLLDAFRKGVLGILQSTTNANTAVQFHAGRLLALNEAAAPYAMRITEDQKIETIGQLPVSGSFTAHPKIDPDTGILHFFGHSRQAPYLSYGEMCPDGKLIKYLPIDLPSSIISHDFAITKHHVLFLDLPLITDGERMVKEDTFLLDFKPEGRCRIGVMPITAQSQDEITWMDFPKCMIFHVLNAWENADVASAEDVDSITMVACPSEDLDFGLTFDANCDRPLSQLPFLTTFNINLRTKQVTQHRLVDQPVDFPINPPNLTGRYSRYGYGAIMDTERSGIRFVGMVKIDMEEGEHGGEIARFELGQGVYCQELTWAPKENMESEDDGYLMGYIQDENEDQSYFAVFDAKTMDPKPIAKAAIPQRVPYGFHGCWLNEQQYNSQLGQHPLSS